MHLTDNTHLTTVRLSLYEARTIAEVHYYWAILLSFCCTHVCFQFNSALAGESFLLQPHIQQVASRLLLLWFRFSSYSAWLPKKDASLLFVIAEEVALSLVNHVGSEVFADNAVPWLACGYGKKKFLDKHDVSRLRKFDLNLTKE